MTGIMLVVMAIGALASGLIASSKNRSFGGWALCGALVPLISLIIVLTLEPRLEAEL